MSKKPVQERQVLVKDDDGRPVFRDANPREMLFMLIGEVAEMQRQLTEQLERMHTFNEYMAGTKGWDDVSE